MKTPRSETLSSITKFAPVVALPALVFFVAFLAACEKPAPKPTPEVMTPVKAAPKEVRAEAFKQDKSGPKVRFRRAKDDTCSWEITGEDVDDILRADRKLRRATAPAPEQKAE